MARPRKPDAIHEINGNPGKRARLKAHQKPDPDSASQSDLSAPDWLCDEGKRQYEDVAPRMARAKLLSIVDVKAFSVGMDALGIYITAARERNKQMAEKGPSALITISEDESKGKGPNPWMVVQSMAFKTFNKIASEFGMTPAARAKIALQPQSDMFDDVPISDRATAAAESAQPQSKAAKYLTPGASGRIN